MPENHGDRFVSLHQGGLVLGRGLETQRHYPQAHDQPERPQHEGTPAAEGMDGKGFGRRCGHGAVLGEAGGVAKPSFRWFDGAGGADPGPLIAGSRWSGSLNAARSTPIRLGQRGSGVWFGGVEGEWRLKPEEPKSDRTETEREGTR